MYFSTNSRYVLHRAPWMSQSAYFIKGAEKLLSVKVPGEDPSKPPLRVNIPKESQDNRSKVIHNSNLRGFAEPRSKSMVSPPKTHALGSSFKNELLPKSESETQLVQSNAEDFSLEADIASSSTPQQYYCVEKKTENNYYENYQPSNAEAVVAENYSARYQTNVENNTSLEEETSLPQQEKPKAEEPDPKTLYIIVDSAEKSNKKVAKICNEEVTTPVSSERNDYVTTGNATQRQSKHTPHGHKSENQSLKKNKSFPKMAKSEAKQKQFEVQEIEDYATFVSHSRQNRDNLTKTNQVECVPEKELTTRSNSRNANEASIKVRKRNSKGLDSEITSVDELSDFDYVKPTDTIRPTDSKKKLKSRKSENANTEMFNREEYMHQNKSSSKQYLSEPEYTYDSVDQMKGKYAEYYATNDLRTDRSSRKTAVREIPEQNDETMATHLQAEEQEPTPEYCATKEEYANYETQSSHWGSHNSYPQDTNQVQYRDWICPKPFDQTECPDVKPMRKNKKPSKKRPGKTASPEVTPEKSHSSSKRNDKSNSDIANFQSSGSFVSIGCDKTPSVPSKFGVAFPPLLCEALKLRGRILGFRREFLFCDKWAGRYDYKTIGSKSKNRVDLSENSILFPKTDGEKFDCNSLFCTKDDNTSQTPTNQEGEKSPKISDNFANLANEGLTDTKGSTSVDSLAMMKKVKEIVDFDLENAIKIFKNANNPVEIPSVVVFDDGKWKVDTEALDECIKFRKEEQTFDLFDNVKLNKKILGDDKKNVEIQDISENTPKYLPPRKDSAFQMKLKDHTNSVISLNPNTNSFFLNKEALSEAIRQKEDESFDDAIVQTLEGQLANQNGNNSFVIFDRKDNSAFLMQNGDSILVFDEENQTWKVDYSILEKREQKLRMEEELSKRSELILETFENLERNHISKIPKPDTKQKKMFDYAKEEWRSLPQEKKPKDKKLPFKESNAEEIRRSNADLYENLFVGNKNETTMNKNNTEPSSDKETKSCSSKAMKAAESGSTTGSGKAVDEIKPGKPEKMEKEKAETEKPCDSTEDNYWETFLNMNILPKDIRETPTKRPPLPPPPPGPPVSPPVAPPKSKIPWGLPKAEEPKPAVKDPALVPPNKIDDPKGGDIPVKKIEEPRLRGFFIPFIGDKRISDKKSKTPKTDDPKNKSEPPVGGKEIQIKVPSKESPKIESPSKSGPTIGSEVTQDTQIKAPSKESPKIEDPKNKPLDKTPTAGGISSETTTKTTPSESSTKATTNESATKATTSETATKTTPSESSTKATTSEPATKTIPSESSTKATTSETATKTTPSESATKATPSESSTKATPSESSTKATTNESATKATPSESSTKATTNESATKATPSESPKVEPQNKSSESSSTASDSAKEKSSEDPSNKPPEPPATSGGDGKKSPPMSVAHPMVNDPKSTKSTPQVGAPKSQKDKSAADHYVSDNIVEMSRNLTKEAPSKLKGNKFETVKLNISSETRMPSKVTEINLNKKCDDKGKDSTTVLKRQSPTDTKKPEAPLKKHEKCTVENKTFYKNFEKYKTPFTDPEYEEKTMKIKSDIESNPNLKKLDNWNKTLVLHDIGKPPENLENWLKDETDKMATLLLKVLQEAADGKPRKKPSLVRLKPNEKTPGKGNAFDTQPRKFETTPENFLFRVRTVNLSLENDKNLKSAEDRNSKPLPKSSGTGLQEKNAGKPCKVTETAKAFPETQLQNSAANMKIEGIPTISDNQKNKPSPTALESVEHLETSAVSKDFATQNTLPVEITEEVPGPEFLKKLSNTWKVFPIIGSQLTIVTLLRAYQLVNLGNTLFSSSSQEKSKADAFSKLFSKYGPIVNVQGPLSGNVILIHKPEHFSSVFEQDNVTPIRSVFDSMEQCRRESDDKVLSTTISVDWSKPEWNDLKRGFNDHLMRSGEKCFISAEAAGDSLINSIRKTKNQQNYVSEDFMEEIKRWSLEGLCSTIFEKSYGFLERKNNNMNWVMEPDKLYFAINEATQYLSKCEKGFQTWRLMSTPSLSGLGQAYRSLSTILYKLLYQAELNLKNKSEIMKERNPLISEDLTLLESMLLNDGLTMDELTCNLTDIMVLGTNLMSSALGFLFYNLAQNVKVQNQLVKELKKALPNKNSPLDYYTLDSLKYLQACVKESLRMHIPVPLFYRLLQTDILLSNYVIPKGTYVVMDYRVNCMKEQIFDDPEKFMPERWLNEEKWMKNVHPFDTFPICHGPRAELVKKIIEMQLLACAAKVVRNFGIEYHYGEIEGTNSLISFPDKPLKLNFADRES